MPTAREALAEAERRLAAAGVETPRVDAEWLLAHLLGTTRSGLRARLDDPVDGLEPLLSRREAREPLAYVLGEWGFRRLLLRTDSRDSMYFVYSGWSASYSSLEWGIRRMILRTSSRLNLGGGNCFKGV